MNIALALKVCPLIILALTLSLSFLISPSTAQEKNDSLILASRQLPRKDGHDLLIASVRADFGRRSYPALFQLASEAYCFALEANDTARIIQSARISGQLLNYMDRSGDAIVVLDDLESLGLDRYPSEYHLVHLNRAIAHTSLGEYEKALEIYFSLLDKGYDKRELAIVYTNLGFTYSRLNNHSKSIYYSQRALSVGEYNVNENEYKLLTLNVAVSYNAIGKYEEAEKSLDKLVNLCKRDCSSHLLVALYKLAADTYLHTNRLDSAAIFYDSAEHLALMDKNNVDLSDIYLGKGNVFLKQGCFDEAVQYMDKSESLSLSARYLEGLTRVYKSKADLYQRMGNDKLHSYYLSRSVDMKDSLYGPNVFAAVSDAQLAFQERVNNKQVSSLSFRNKMLLVTALVLCVVLIILFRNLKSVRSLTRKLDRRVQTVTNDLASSKEELLLSKSGSEIRYRQVSGDIRAPLATIKGVCNVAMLDVSDEKSRQYFERINETAEKLQAVVDNMSREDSNCDDDTVARAN
jgi:tetratricopeptide (TPR) repeat protein